MSSSTSAAQKRLVDLYGQLGTWKKVAARLTGCDRALLCRVATGKQKAPRSVVRALAADYASWRTTNMPELLAIVAWAETPPDERV